MTRPGKMVHPVHFEDYSGEQFERLVHAYHLRVEPQTNWEWYGQVGSDLGRDIWGVRENGETVCIQCVNRAALTFDKGSADLDKAARGPKGTPSLFRIVCRSTVSADMRDRLKKHASGLGVPTCDIWAGADFEERLRRDTEALLKRFCEGEPFPDAVDTRAEFATVDPGHGEREPRAGGPSIGVQLCDPVTRSVLDPVRITSRVLRTREVAPSLMYLNRAVLGLLDRSVMDAISATTGPIAEEVDAYRQEMALLTELAFRFENRGTQALSNVSLAGTVTKEDGLRLSDKAPKKPQGRFDPPSLQLPMPPEQLETTITEVGEDWRLECYIGKLRPGETLWSTPFWIGSTVPLTLELSIRLLGDNLPQPVNLVETIEIEVEESRLKDAPENGNEESEPTSP